MAAAKHTLGLVILAIMALSPAGAKAQVDTFEWSDNMASGQVLEVQGIVGEITVALATGGRASVVANKRGNEGDFPEVAIEVAEAGNRVVICAVYGSWNHGQDRCHPDHRNRGNEDEGQNRNLNIDVEVDYEVRLPAGVEFEGTLVSGDIRAEGLRSDVSLTTVDGGISVVTTGRAQARTVSGDLEIQMGDFAGDLDFNTVSGDITLWLPANFSADVEFSSLSGDFDTDFDMTVTNQRERRWVGSRIEGTIGGGGRQLSFSTISGDVELRRSGR